MDTSVCITSTGHYVIIYIQRTGSGKLVGNDLLLFPYWLGNDEHVVKQEEESFMRLQSLGEAIKEESGI